MPTNNFNEAYYVRQGRARKEGFAPIAMSLAELEAWYETQERVCAICRRPEPDGALGFREKLGIDHCHVTGKVRGTLQSL